MFFKTEYLSIKSNQSQNQYVVHYKAKQQVFSKFTKPVIKKNSRKQSWDKYEEQKDGKTNKNACLLWFHP